MPFGTRIYIIELIFLALSYFVVINYIILYKNALARSNYIAKYYYYLFVIISLFILQRCQPADWQHRSEAADSRLRCSGEAGIQGHGRRRVPGAAPRHHRLHGPWSKTETTGMLRWCRKHGRLVFPDTNDELSKYILIMWRECPQTGTSHLAFLTLAI